MGGAQLEDAALDQHTHARTHSLLAVSLLLSQLHEKLCSRLVRSSSSPEPDTAGNSRALTHRDTRGGGTAGEVTFASAWRCAFLCRPPIERVLQTRSRFAPALSPTGFIRVDRLKISGFYRHIEKPWKIPGC